MNGNEEKLANLESELESLKQELSKKNSNASNPNLIPGAIILAGLIIAGALVAQGGLELDLFKEEHPARVTANDHILGSLDAPVKVIEYSDLECPFCKSFHPTLRRAFDEYGRSGQIAWIYRHFPLVGLHPLAPKEAEASECVAELGGNDKFWAFIDRVFEITPSNNGLNPELLPEIASYIGVEKTQFNECLNSGKYESKIMDQYNDAIASAGNGTPFTVVINKKGKKFPVTGAVPYESLKSTIENALK